ncbi:MAG: DUF1080 domain-containing protein [Tannerellaceae bacterium]|nr:DUF1080 domain-containing protein [Tannerellaceae bacterium]
MQTIHYFLAASLLFACTGKKDGQTPLTTADPVSLYNEIRCEAQPNTLSAGEKSAGWTLLFDGTTGTSWHGYNQQGMPDCWTLEDGSLTMQSIGGGEEQDLITDKTYKSFALSLEYKMTQGANSGVLFHVKEDSAYTFAYETGPEFQVIDHENWPDPLEDVQINGSNYAMYPPVEKPYKPMGEWNRLMLVVEGNKVTQLLNGVVTVAYEKYSDDWNQRRNSGKWADYPHYGNFDEGHISLQNHGTKVWYRNIKLKEL